MKTKHTRQAKGGGSINKVAPTGSPDRSEKQIHLPVYPPSPQASGVLILLLGGLFVQNGYEPPAFRRHVFICVNEWTLPA